METKVEATYGTKDDPVPSHIQVVPTMNTKPRLPTKVFFKGGSTPSTPNPFFFLASPNLGTRFLLRVVVCHIPKIWNVKINKNRTMLV
jgi:hypothetical protein